jgi:hypothetical protein
MDTYKAKKLRVYVLFSEKNKINYKIYILIAFFTLFVSAYSDRCYDIQLLDGSEQLVDFGFDTTYNWWAVTQPYSNKQKMYINDYASDSYFSVSKPIFSPDGDRWAFFVKGVSGWNLVCDKVEYKLDADKPGVIVFSSNSENIVYSYYMGDLETIISVDDTVQMRYRSGELYVNRDGRKFAFVENRGGVKSIYDDGQISDSYEDILPIGYWNDDRFAYGTFDGANWEIRIGNEVVSDIYQSITEAKINLDGEYLAFVGSLAFGRQEAVLISNQMKEPIMGKNYPLISGLAIHPHEPMIAYKAKTQLNNEIIVFNSVEYSSGRENSQPFFSYDGSEMYFISCNIDCYLVVNGRRINAPNGIFLDGTYARKPKSNTIAYASSASLVVRDLDTQTLYAGKMMDYTGPVRYNWRMDEYESLGVINNRLYLQVCGLSD